MQNTLRGITAGITLITLAIAFFFGRGNWGSYFLPLLFAGLALSVLVGSFSAVNAKGVFGGFQGFIWLLGLAFCFLPAVGFWPWILVVAGVSVIVGALTVPIVNGLQRVGLYSGITMAKSQQPQLTPQEGGQQYANPQQDS